MVKVYIHDNKVDSDYRAPHNSGTELSLDELAKLGVIYKYCANEEEVNEIARQREYKNRDVVNICEGSFKSEAEFNEKLATFYQEHLHEDEEIRYCLEGAGYFDVRMLHQRAGSRVFGKSGDLRFLTGNYHRFTLTTSNHIKALRLFKDEPKWQLIAGMIFDSLPVRKDYIALINQY
ncbi:AVN_HP_G0038660.mRNA.1.CDS.1 [Saccharomyces cerevisiae]|nr:AVN_HP_G0038660.mRNA.1.CDS.1 [Saccharomyces cerevisiae]CAI6876385.1 AVN_HP_G0038660.mRNA.1.CDS.1 [Saccharomyces cerevisiae]